MIRYPAAASALISACLFTGCFPGGTLNREGGQIREIGLMPSATRLYRSPYEILCFDESRRKEYEQAKDRGENPPPPVLSVAPDQYKGGCEQTGRHSVLFLFGFFPVTPPVNPEYAMSQAVQKLEGDTIINVTAWNEIHYYSILGRVSVFKVKGDVIRFPRRENP